MLGLMAAFSVLRVTNLCMRAGLPNFSKSWRQSLAKSIPKIAQLIHFSFVAQSGRQSFKK